MRLLNLVLIVGLTLSSGLEAQAQKPQTSPRIRPVERGFFAEMNAGLTTMLTPVADRKLAPGVGVGMYFGYDIVPYLSLLGGVQMFTASGTGDDLASQSDGLWVTPMLKLQLALMTSERHFVWARLGAGWGFGFPKQIGSVVVTGEPGLVASASVSYEYFTVLRRFSVGARIGAVALSQPGWSVGMTVMPTLKYTF